MGVGLGQTVWGWSVSPSHVPSFCTRGRPLRCYSDYLKRKPSAGSSPLEELLGKRTNGGLGMCGGLIRQAAELLCKPGHRCLLEELWVIAHVKGQLVPL